MSLKIKGTGFPAIRLLKAPPAFAGMTTKSDLTSVASRPLGPQHGWNDSPMSVGMMRAHGQTLADQGRSARIKEYDLRLVTLAGEVP